MKCFGSPTTSIVPNLRPGAATAPAENATRSREAAATFGALLFREAFAPIAKSLGFYGDTVVGLVAQSVARSERGGLTDRLERAIESASQPRAASAGETR